MPYNNEPIAVVGSGCRFPGESSTPSKLWDLLRDPRDVQRKIDRFRADNFYNKDGHYHGASNVLDSYLLAEDTRLFDAQFFNIPLSEAEAIDPQQRLLMETVYESLDAAGLSMESLTGSKTAVYVGVMCDDFSQIVYGDSENVPTYAATGSARSILSNRVSYFFNWHGPSMTIDTACSSSLIAVHQAVQVLRSGESPVAVAAGTNLIFGPTMFVAESNLNMLSATGRSRMWDASADGYARGEGVGSIVMKTLSAALRDGDHIECIIRETGINQDGKTPGITMPSSDLQASLIHETYARAGLDPSKRGERCQYFEAHGTGTKAGDPQEAGAIHKAFFSKRDGNTSDDEGFEGEDVLYVGSIKTIIGHTEGTAGIAGLMKASLAIQNKMIPPNMHFTRLNPDLEPYYGNLKVPIELRKWPELPPGTPRRASVNSFGFGGANAHAIIESYEPEQKAILPSPSLGTSQSAPHAFVFSAASEKSLVASLRSYLKFLRENPDYSPATLAWSLYRRTALKFRVSYSAFSIEGLVSQIEKSLEESESKKEHLGIRVNPKSPNSILGIFTGQGAQWATMGRQLLLCSPFAASIIENLEASLAELPDRPDWSLRAEILASKETSRIASAVISQPLCTAIQIMVVDLLRHAGVDFSAVVGHSSGEIACAYAAGFLSATDAIRVAYYRGQHSGLARGKDGKRGAMIAAGTDMEDAIDLCSLPKLKGRAQLAASNSSASVTISGDADAIDLVEMVFQDESKFARKLKVDTAYHCFHMQPCSEPYVESLRKCGVQVTEPSVNACPWYSSVLGGDRVTMDMSSKLQGEYWRDNMLQPVLFSQALKAALAGSGAPGLALEVGPHPALKGPASLTIEETVGSSVPYFGTVTRGNDDALAIAASLGSIWGVLGSSAVDYQAFHSAFAKGTTLAIAKDLPTYTWDHEKVVWNETRVSKAHRLRAHSTHALLGPRTIDEQEGELRWRNYLKPSELPFLRGHQIQGQMVFPAAGFAVMALEAAKSLATTESIRLLELRNFSIHKALPFMDENAAVETLFVLSNIRKEDGLITANFDCNACMNKDVGSFTSMANGQVLITIGEPSDEALPERPQWVNNFVNTDVGYFYDSLAALGYGYTGMFYGVTDLQRTNGYSKGTITIPTDDDSPPSDWVIHPATLDVAFQSVFAAVGAPGDGRLWTMHVPTMIDSITVNPSACEVGSGVEVPLPFDACLAQDSNSGIAGDVDLYDEDGKNAIVQIQGLHVSPLSRPTADDDRETFAATTWGPAQADLVTDWKEWKLSDDDEKIAAFAERLSLFIVRELYETVKADDTEDSTEHQLAILQWAENIVKATEAGEHPTCIKQWLVDTWDVLKTPAERLARSNAQIRRCLTLKERLAAFVRGELSAEDDLELNRVSSEFFEAIPGFQLYHERMSMLIDQLAFKHRNLKVLEIGGGKGTCAKAVLDTMGDNFMSYTFTDVEPDHFDKVRSMFPEHQAEKMQFRVMDPEYEVADQGFTAGYYDLVIASNSIHTTASLQCALENVRSLIRPGGYLALLETTNDKSLSYALQGCVRPDWFVGVDDGREHSPFVNQKSWDNILRESGFSGIDTSTPEERTYTVPFSVMCSMAVNKEMELIRDPLAFSGEKQFDAKLLIIGGQAVQTNRLVRGLKNVLSPFFKEVIHVETLVEVEDDMLDAKPAIINLMELDEPMFKPFTEAKFKAVVKLCDNSHNMLWITVGSRGENPYMNMMVAVGRCLVGEMSSLRLQFLNFDGSDRPTPNVVAHHLLRLHATYGFSADSIKINDPLYTIERELSIQNNTLILPRYLPVEAINARVNSEKRLITEDMDQTKTAIKAEAAGSTYRLLEQPQPIDEPDMVTIHVAKSLLNSIKIGSAGSFYVVLGSVEGASKKVIALSQENQSIVAVPDSWIAEVDVRETNECQLLVRAAANLLANTIVADAPGTVLVHEPTAMLAQCIQNRAANMKKSIVMTSVSPSHGAVKQVHHLAQDRVLAKAVPKGVVAFFDLSESTQAKIVGAKLASHLPLGCEIKTISTLYNTEAFALAAADPSGALAAAIDGCAKLETLKEAGLKVIPASDLSSETVKSTGLHVVDWQSKPTLPVAIVPADQSIRFRSDRTYFMVGLTGELGLQLTKWMVQHGARYLALSSRSPSVDARWLEFVQAEGAVVKVYPMDVTSRASVRAATQQIAKEMPPVAGVANGAMILIDGLFANKTHAEFDKTLRPKVDGTVFLDEIYNKNDLDFFIVFSSLACVSGNMGQTAYAAANAFMCSLVAGRRMRGLAGSAINMPGIVGLGYLNRDPRKLDRLKNVGYVNISEWEFYQFFSEAITAGHPDSGMNPEITAGLQRIDMERNPNPPIWANTPRFNWLQMVKPSGEITADGEGDGNSVRSRLAELTDPADVYKLLLEGLLNTLYTRLNMSPEERGITPDTAIVELGVDSLLAVDMRSWFTKELDLDMPVLKILGGATVNELVEDAISRLSPDLTPKLARGDAEPEEASAETSKGEETAETETDDQEVSEEAEETATDSTAEQQVEDDVKEEELTVAPIDLPDFDYSASDASTPTTATNAEEQIEVALPNKFLAPKPADLARAISTDSLLLDGHATPATPATSHSDFEEEKPKDVADDEEEYEMVEPGARLFSHLPDYVEQAPEFIKKEKMSYGTSRFWFLMQYLEDPTTFNLLCHLKFTGPIRLADADRSVIELGNRHEVFRTCFFADPERMNEPTMGVLKETPLRLERRRATSEDEVDAEIAEIMNYEFKIEQGETIRIKMVSLDDMTHHVIFGFHHIAMDGFSFNLLLPEINKLYDSEPMEVIATPFSDFAARQRLQVANGSLDGEFQFWKNMYSTKLPSGEMKPDFPDALPLFSVAKGPRRGLENYEFEESKLLLDTKTVRQIKAQCRRHKITTFHFFLGVLRTFLFRHIDVDDLVIGIADANRADESLDRTIGFMLNLLPLRFKSENKDRNTSFRDIALDARTKAYDALAHSSIPFDALLEKLDIPRSANHSPLFQVWMDYRPFTMDAKPKMFGGEVTGSQSVGRNGYDLTLDVNEVAGSEIRVSFRTQKYLYSAESTQLLFDSYLRLVKAFANSFDTNVDAVSLWDQKDIEAAKTLGRGPRLESTWEDTVSQRIAAIATKHADQEALKDGSGATLTYNVMQRRVQSISEALVKAGVQQGSRVAVFQQPSVDWICSLLAIWHAGGTYIPLDLRSSLPRLALITKAARPTVILSHVDSDEQVAELESSAASINVSKLEPVSTFTNSKARPDVPAAILYTSGSTGTPKGVVLPHSAFKNTIEGLTSQYQIGAERVLQQSAYTFDFSLDQILCGLVNGGSVYVVSKESRGDPIAISQIIANENITYTRATPSEYASWITYGATDLMRASEWRFAWGGGEVMPKSLRQSVESLGLEDLKLYNSYGPAESITCTKTEIPYGPDFDDDDIPAGFPLPNYTVYIVDRNLDLVPQGVAGEIVISGPSVAKGYLNNEKLSDTKFIGNCYAPADLASKDGRIVYRTGDVGHLRNDGALMFKGRIAGDTQIKLRGIRIELEDIESSILQASEGAVHAAVVSVRGELLVAHVQFAPGQYTDENEQKAFLRSLRFILPLPVYMVPSIFIPLAQIPVNAHGKCDRKAVQALEIPQANRGRSGEALTETERTLIELWREVIPEDTTGAVEISDGTTFFELGGNSLLLVKLQILVNMRFNAKLSLVDLFSAVTLGAQAAKIDAAEPADNVDWATETAVDAAIVAAAGARSHIPVKTSGQKVIVTGSTGLVGRNLVQALTASEKVSEIHCVAVRSRNREGVNSSKVKVYPGDLAAPRLGLSEQDFEFLASNADLIIHAGASRSLLDAYQLLRGPNFESTKTLVQLAAARRIPFHYISSGSVATMTDATPPTGGADGYVATKWASEQYLTHAAAQLELPVAVHQVVLPRGDVSDRTEDIVAHLRDLASRMQTSPLPSGWSVDLDMIKVDSLTRQMATSLLDGSVPTSAAPRQTYASEATIDLDSVLAQVAEGQDSKARTLPAVQWIAQARARGLEWQIATMDKMPFNEAEQAPAN
ncbi:hypothetical protein F5Y15DRAFT_411391 [Xylariaceae sp. FL0016]|nr:hypothetical protein F5Y15DRAFT_411391 [Xylariaceae sp. FL0016]